MLSKSKFISGSQCLKKLYLEKHCPDLKPAVSPELQARFDQGHQVGELAQQAYPGGKDATPKDYSDFGPSLKNTQQWLDGFWPTIYEATFSAHGVLALLDIFHRNGELAEAIEVKSSTKIKDYHLQDAAIQYYVMEQAGYRPDRFYIMHLNPGYRLKGTLDPVALFTKVDVTNEVLAQQADIPQRLEEMKNALNQSNPPEIEIGPHCNSPFACDFQHLCWKHVPQPSVFEVSRIGARAWQFYQQGTLAIADLEEDHFRGKAKLQIEGVKYGKERSDENKIKSWLATADYPLYFLDFETIGLNVAIPVYEGTGPYQQIPVQYSLHVLESPQGELKHLEFLPNFSEDPREALAKALCEQIGEKGSIVVYSKSFESRCLKHLAELLPQYSQALEDFRDRLFDLIDPFRKNWLYKPAMGKSASIKSVYPALFPEDDQGYGGLIINNGGDATMYLAALAKGTFKGNATERAQLYEDLKAYCELDTLAMVKIWNYLEATVTKKD